MDTPKCTDTSTFDSPTFNVPTSGVPALDALPPSTPPNETPPLAHSAPTSTAATPLRKPPFAQHREIFAIYVPESPARHVFTELADVRKFLGSEEGKREGTRFKKCTDKEEVDLFFAKRVAEKDSVGASTSASPQNSEPVSPYKSPPIARATELRKAIEQRDNERFERLIAENPGFLINTNNDRPNVLHAGFRYNALHIACRASNLYVVERVIQLITDPAWLATVYGTESCLDARLAYILDAFLNTPDTAEYNTPLHYACKFGSLLIADELLKHPACRKKPKNKYNETPMDMMCRGFKGSPSERRDVAHKLTVRLSPLIVRKKSKDEEEEPAAEEKTSQAKDGAVVANGDMARADHHNSEESSHDMELLETVLQRVRLVHRPGGTHFICAVALLFSLLALVLAIYRRRV